MHQRYEDYHDANMAPPSRLPAKPEPGTYDGDTQMFVQAAREPDFRYLAALRDRFWSEDVALAIK